MSENMDILLICFEQIYTTTETIRRRFLSYFDEFAYSGQLCLQYLSQIHQSVEPTVLDGIDCVKLACATTNEPLNNINVESRNTLMELYYSISTLLLSFVFGQLAGANALRYMFGVMPTSFLIIGIIVLTKYFYNYLTTRTLDEADERCFSLQYSLALGILIGLFSADCVNTFSPTSLFHMPILLALLIDNESVIKMLPAMDKQTFLTLISSFSIISCSISVFFNENSHFVPSLFTYIYSFDIYLFLICLRKMSEKSFNSSEAQFSYITLIGGLQIVLNTVFA